MFIRDFKDIFYKELLQEYPQTEIDAFFRLLGENILGMTRVEMVMNPRRILKQEEAEKLFSGLSRLLDHEPIQYILGETEFYGLPFKVDKNVLIPRPETEGLVEWVLCDLKTDGPCFLRMLDIGTGSGCIAVTLAFQIPQGKVTALDLSQKALGVARQNGKRNQVQVNFKRQDILQTEDLGESFDIIISNPPYVQEMEKILLKRNVLDNEPKEALFVKDDNPLLFYDKIAKLAQNALAENGRLYFEINQYLALDTEKLLQSYGFKTELRKDIFGKFRMLKGTR